MKNHFGTNMLKLSGDTVAVTHSPYLDYNQEADVNSYSHSGACMCDRNTAITSWRSTAMSPHIVVFWMFPADAKRFQAESWEIWIVPVLPPPHHVIPYCLSSLYLASGAFLLRETLYPINLSQWSTHAAPLALKNISNQLGSLFFLLETHISSTQWTATPFSHSNEMTRRQ